MKWTVWCVLMAAGCVAKEPAPAQRPACSAAIHGQFWPEAANSDRNAASKLSHCGALEICTVKGWRYKWQPVTVHVRQLGKSPQAPTAACAAVFDEFGDKAR